MRWANGGLAAFAHLSLAAIGLLLSGLVGCASTMNELDERRFAITTQQLTRQADAWDQAIVRKDLAGIESNMADDFRQIAGNGGIQSRDAFIAGLMSPKLTLHPYTVEEFEIRQYGNVALLSGRTRMTGTYDGQAFASHYRYIDVYVRSQDGTWKITSVQITYLPN